VICNTVAICRIGGVLGISTGAGAGGGTSAGASPSSPSGSPNLRPKNLMPKKEDEDDPFAEFGRDFFGRHHIDM
jgi:hypothetical protein